MASQRKEFNKVVISSLHDLHARVKNLEIIIGHILSQAEKAQLEQNPTPQDVVGTDVGVLGVSNLASNVANQEILPMGAIGLEDGDFTGDDQA